MVNTTGGSNWVQNCSGGTVPATLPPIRGITLSWVNGSVTGGGNIVTASLGNVCNVKEIYYQDLNVGFNSSLYNSTTLETSSENFFANFTSTTAISSASLIYNNTAYTASVTSLGSNIYNLQKTIDIPLGNRPVLGNQWFWNLTYSNGTTASSSAQTQYFEVMNFSLCSGATVQNITYLNFTFKNETPTQERINASITTSLFSYWFGSGTVNRTLSYTSSSENREYAFCFTPSYKSVNLDVALTYDNSESEQRVYSPDTMLLSNTSTIKTLYLLPSISGQYVTFQVINPGQQSIEGVMVTATRSGIGVVETGVTDATGSVTFFLNPNFAYEFVFSKTGFDDFETTITPTQTQYTITMGSGSSTNNTNSQTGISYTILPRIQTLNNNTNYNFNFTLNSSYWTLDSWGFTLTNRSGFVFDSETSTSSNGGFLSSTLNTGLNSSITMNYFWVIDGVYNNASVTWGVADLSDSGFSLKQLRDDFNSYVTVGFFGLSSFGMALIAFVAIFAITGVASYKWGITTPFPIMALVFALTFFFDVGLAWIPEPVNAIPNLVTWFVGIILLAALVREVRR